jgi:hypothetical protein
MTAQLDTLKEVLGELFALLEAQEANSAAILQFLKDQGITTDDQLAPYLEQAGRASNVKWRAARMRMEYLLTPVQKENAESKPLADNSNKEQQNSQSSSNGEAAEASNDGRPTPENLRGEAKAENASPENATAAAAADDDRKHTNTQQQ